MLSNEEEEDDKKKSPATNSSSPSSPTSPSSPLLSTNNVASNTIKSLDQNLSRKRSGSNNDLLTYWRDKERASVSSTSSPLLASGEFLLLQKYSKSFLLMISLTFRSLDLILLSQ